MEPENNQNMHQSQSSEQAQPTTSAQNVAVAPKKKGLARFVLITVLLIVVVAAGAYYYLTQIRESKPTSEATTTQTRATTETSGQIASGNTTDATAKDDIDKEISTSDKSMDALNDDQDLGQDKLSDTQVGL